ncbi:hypothetical protein YQE_05945, partial [Dendroctonus ponderosae]
MPGTEIEANPMCFASKKIRWLMEAPWGAWFKTFWLRWKAATATSVTLVFQCPNLNGTFWWLITCSLATARWTSWVRIAKYRISKLESNLKVHRISKYYGIDPNHSHKTRKVQYFGRKLLRMAEDRKKFYCREWAFQKLLHCLDQRPVSKTCGALLLGSSGCGKTTFCSELCWPSQGPSGRQQRTLNRRLLCYHFLQGHNEKSLSLSEFVRSLVTQILNHSTESHKERSMRRKIAQAKEQGETVSPKNTSYDKNLSENCNLPQESLYSNVYSENLLSPTLEAKKVPDPAPIPNMPINPRTVIADAYLEKLKSDPEIQIALRAKNIESNPDDCLKRALLFPLLEIDPPKTSLFIIIDSIDEHSFIYSNSTLTRSKPRERSSQSRTIAEKLSLDDLRKAQVVRDVQQYILARLDQENSLRQHISRDTAEMLNQLHIKSNGCFLYLEKVLDGVAESFIVLREVREIPGTLNGLYLWLCQRLFNRRQFAKVQPLLNVILAAKCALNESLLFDIVKVNNSKITIEDFRKRFHLLKKVVVISKNGTIRLFHHSFAEWLLDIKHCTQKYLCNIFHGHCILAMYYTLHAKVLNNQEIYDYAFHLTRMEQFLNEKPSQKCPTFMYKLSQEKAGNSLDKTSTEIYSDLKALQEHFDSVHLKSPESEKNPIYAEVNKLKKTSNQITKSVEVSNQLMTTSCENNLLVTDYTNTASSLNNTATSCTMLEGALSKTQQHPILDLHTLTVLWLINSGCNVEECLLEGNEMAGVNFGAFLPTDQKVLRLLLEAGAVEQHDVAGCDYESQLYMRKLDRVT